MKGVMDAVLQNATLHAHFLCIFDIFLYPKIFMSSTYRILFNNNNSTHSEHKFTERSTLNTHTRTRKLVHVQQKIIFTIRLLGLTAIPNQIAKIHSVLFCC